MVRFGSDGARNAGDWVLLVAPQSIVGNSGSSEDIDAAAPTGVGVSGARVHVSI